MEPPVVSVIVTYILDGGIITGSVVEITCPYCNRPYEGRYRSRNNAEVWRVKKKIAHHINDLHPDKPLPEYEKPQYRQ